MAFTVDDLQEATSSAQISESLVADSLDTYHARDELFPGGEEEARAVEREVMLQIIDQRWRDHLADMDYLREGINLRAMGQQDPLVAWQREGFEMFGQMMDSIDDDYTRYVMHVQVIAAPAAEPDLAQASYQAAEDPSQGPSILDVFRSTGEEAEPTGNGSGAAGSVATQVASPRQSAGQPQAPARAAGAARAGANGRNGRNGREGRNIRNEQRAPRTAAPTDPEAQVPIVKGAQQKLGRNEPCWCGSGKKFKLCHGAG